MILVSMLVMYVLMYLNTYALDHPAWSQTRGWMALMMGGVMAVIMLAFMWGMYASRGINWGIVAASLGRVLKVGSCSRSHVFHEEVEERSDP